MYFKKYLNNNVTESEGDWMNIKRVLEKSGSKGHFPSNPINHLECKRSRENSQIKMFNPKLLKTSYAT